MPLALDNAWVNSYNVLISPELAAISSNRSEPLE
jgi:hypothetical protein